MSKQNPTDLEKSSRIVDLETKRLLKKIDDLQIENATLKTWARQVNSFHKYGKPTDLDRKVEAILGGEE